MLFRLFERGFVFVLLFFLMGAATALFYANTDTDSYLALQGSLHLPIVIIQLGISMLAAFLILTRWRRVAAAALHAWPLLLLAGLQVLSALWSIHPSLTLRKTVLEIVMLAIGIYLGERYTTKEFARLIAMVLCQAVVAILILLAVAPHLVLEADAHNALKGLSQNKNGFGFYIGLTVALLFLVRFKSRDWLRYAFIPLACVMLLLSRSMTSVAAAAIIMVTLPLWLLVRLPAKQRVVGYMFVIVMLGLIGSLCIAESTYLLSLLGKDSTLTGRTEVWNQLVIAIRHHPVLGYGYGAFWTGLKGESLDVLVTSGWIVPSAHNAYLELWLAMGIPGLICTAILCGDAFRRAIEYIRFEPTLLGLWPVAFLCFLLAHGLGESEFIYDSSMAGCLFTAIYTSLVRTRPGRRTGAREALLADDSVMPATLVSP